MGKSPAFNLLKVRKVFLFGKVIGIINKTCILFPGKLINFVVKDGDTFAKILALKRYLLVRLPGFIIKFMQYRFVV